MSHDLSRQSNVFSHWISSNCEEAGQQLLNGIANWLHTTNLVNWTIPSSYIAYKFLTCSKAFTAVVDIYTPTMQAMICLTIFNSLLFLPSKHLWFPLLPLKLTVSRMCWWHLNPNKHCILLLQYTMSKLTPALKLQPYYCCWYIV